MSLAATLSAGGMRPASFLPAIKCSSCGDEIEIASMGDHVCAKGPPSPRSQPASLNNPFTLRQLNANGHMPHAPSPLSNHPLPQTRVRSPTVTAKQMVAPKPPKTAPPRINPDAANRPFLAPKPPRSESPISPAISVRSGSSYGSRPGIVRSATSPMPRIFDPRPPSPELSSNLDCAFPAFPSFPTPSSTGSGSRPGTSNGSKTPNGSERAPSRAGSRQDSALGTMGDSTMQKIDNMKSGPFDARQRRPSGQDPSAPEPTDRRRPSLSSINFSSRGPPPVPSQPVPRPSTSHSNRSQTPQPSTLPYNNARPDEHSMQKRGPPSRPERSAEDELSPQFLDHLSAEPIVEMPSTFSPSQPPVPIRSTDRSRTFPMRQGSDEPTHSHTLAKTPSEPQMRGRERRPTLTATAAKSEPSHIPQIADCARSQSRGAPRMDQRILNAPPVPKPVQQHRQEPMHAPSGSGSSTASSTRSIGNSNSSGPSPVTSAASSVDAFSPLTYNSQKYGEDERMRVAGLNVKGPQKPGMRAEQAAQRSPPKKPTRRSPPQQIAQLVEREPTLPALISPPLESPMDPGMHIQQPTATGYDPWQPAQSRERRPTLSRSQTMPEREAEIVPAPPVPSLTVQQPPSGDYDPYRPATPQAQAVPSAKPAAAPQYAAYNAGSSLRPRSPQPIPRPPPIPQETSKAQPPTRRGTVAKPTCRGCNLVIEGKSVKAADGRLTGRWHKACFTCQACREPFTTADFYVINNHPYCEQHYHEKNGSLCHGCSRGIEGQYLETTSSSAVGSADKKFHPRCFTCHDCRSVLSDDYFEISGKVYCERHALAAMRGQARLAGPGLNPPDKRALTAERRTTKLMMM